MGRVAVCTRFWSTVARPDIHAALDSWVLRSAAYADYVFVAVRVEVDVSDTMAHLAALASQHHLAGKLIALPVSPWGQFTQALNAMLYAAATVTETQKVVYNLDGADVGTDAVEYIVFQSVEVFMDQEHLHCMMKYMGKSMIWSLGRLKECAHR